MAALRCIFEGRRRVCVLIPFCNGVAPLLCCLAQIPRTLPSFREAIGSKRSDTVVAAFSINLHTENPRLATRLGVRVFRRLANEQG